MEIFPTKTLKVSNKLTPTQEQQLLDILGTHNYVFVWDYNDLQGIHPNICKHCIYIKDDSFPIRKSQRRMNPTLKDS